MWKYLPLFVFFLLLFSIGYFIISIPSNSTKDLTSNSILSIPECEEGESKTCETIEGCAGEKFCNKGKFGNCIVPQICKPGSSLECRDNCYVGSKLCNDCGTAYLECSFS